MTATEALPDPAAQAGRSTGWDAALRRHAHLRPDALALRCGDRTRTWQQFDARVERAAAALAGRGVAPGDRVVLLMGNCIEFVEVLVAATRVGAIPVPVNFRLAPAEVEYLLVDSGAVVMVVDQPRAALAGAARAAAGVTGACLVVAGPPGPPAGPPGPAPRTHAGPPDTPAGPGTEDYEAALAAVDPRGAPAVHSAPDDPAVILYTSGTTGRPKGAVLTHHNLVMQAMTILWAWGLSGEDDVVMCAVPLFHVAGVSSVAPNILMGATTVIVPSVTFDPLTIVDTIESCRVTAVFLVPTQWAAVVTVPGLAERRLALRCISWGASPATPALLQAMNEAFPNVANIAVFGQTEMSPVTCALGADDAVRKTGSVGRPVPWVDARIVDDEMVDVAPGAVGEIIYRGPTLMAGYWRRPEATAEAMSGGWFHSGDLVRADEEGFVYVVDRKTDMIISGGENIYCPEVEAAVDAHPGVREVAVVGVPHPRWGESPVAVIVAADPDRPPTLAEVGEWCRARLASYKQPTAVVAVDALPRNAAGKVLKTELRARYARLYAEGGERS